MVLHFFRSVSLLLSWDILQHSSGLMQCSCRMSRDCRHSRCSPGDWVTAVYKNRLLIDHMLEWPVPCVACVGHRLSACKSICDTSVALAQPLQCPWTHVFWDLGLAA